WARVSSSDRKPDIRHGSSYRGERVVQSISATEVRAYAERSGAEALEYVDNGVSGVATRRPALDRMLVAVKRREVRAVVTVKLDRLARSVRHLTELAAELEALGVALVVLDQNIDTSTPSGRLLFNVPGSIAEFERDLIRERTRPGSPTRVARGSGLGVRLRLTPASGTACADSRGAAEARVRSRSFCAEPAVSSRASSARSSRTSWSTSTTRLESESSSRPTPTRGR